jgi:hypothetical protein
VLRGRQLSATSALYCYTGLARGALLATNRVSAELRGLPRPVRNSTVVSPIPQFPARPAGSAAHSGGG